jgi:erythromycin esterase-like protein
VSARTARSSLVAATCALVLTACTVSSGGSASSSGKGTGSTATQSQHRVDWLKANAVPLKVADLGAPSDDLAAVADRLRSARLVGLGEATHGTEEFHDLRFRLVRRLVETGRTRFLILEDEAGAVEPINRYLTTGEGHLHPAMMPLLPYYQVQPYEELFGWLRQWNATHPRDQVQIWGADAQEPGSQLDALASSFPELRRAVATIRPAIDRLDSLEGTDFPPSAQASPKATAAEYARRGWDAPTLRKLAASAIASARREIPALKAQARTTEGARARLLVQALEMSLGLVDPTLIYYVRTEQWAQLNAAAAGGKAGQAERDVILAALATAVVNTYPSSASGVYLAHNAHVSRGYIAAGGPASGRLLREKLGQRLPGGADRVRGRLVHRRRRAQRRHAERGTGLLHGAWHPARLAGHEACADRPAGCLALARRPRSDQDEHAWLFDPLASYSIGGTFSKEDTIVRVLGDRRTQVLPEVADAVLFVRKTTGSVNSPAMEKALADAQRRGPGSG